MIVQFNLDVLFYPSTSSATILISRNAALGDVDLIAESKQVTFYIIYNYAHHLNR